MQKLDLFSAAKLLAELTQHQAMTAVGIIRAGAENAFPIYWFNDLRTGTYIADFSDAKVRGLCESYSDGPQRMTYRSLRELAVGESITVLDFQCTDADFVLLEKIKGRATDDDGNLLGYRHPDTTDCTATVTRDQLFVYAHDLKAYADTLTPEKPDPERRIAVLRQIGGDVKRNRNGTFEITGINALVSKEKADGKPRTDPKTIRQDLKKAAQSEHDAKQEGQQRTPFTWLGQR